MASQDGQTVVRRQAGKFSRIRFIISLVFVLLCIVVFCASIYAWVATTKYNMYFRFPETWQPAFRNQGLSPLCVRGVFHISVVFCRGCGTRGEGIHGNSCLFVRGNDPDALIDPITRKKIGWIGLSYRVMDFGVRRIYIVKFPVWLIAIFCAPYPIVFVRRLLRPHKRRLHNQCLHCAYDLTGNVSGVCPECGTEVCVKKVVY